MEQLLEQMPYAARQGTPDPCLIGTRGEIIADIIDWFTASSKNTSQTQKMYWLHGVAGCGKSTIAKSVAQILEENRRCVSFYFTASQQAEAGPHNLFSTISRDLAAINKGWRIALVDVIRESPKARKSGTVQEQFDNLMMKPSRGFDNFGPILIIIDAIDECGSAEERELVLKTLNHLFHLPDYFRFFITSRTEQDIVESFRNQNQMRIRRLDQADQLSIDRDIALYVEDRLFSIPVLKKNWDRSWVEEIVSRSGQLFQWAFTACKYIRGTPQIGNDPLEQLEFILQSVGFEGLDSLYLGILGKLSSFKIGDKKHQRFVTIMGRILSLYEPLSLESLSALYHDDDDKDKVHTILSPLGSLLRGVDGNDELVQPLHASFIDFLLDENRSGKYWINLGMQREKIPQALLREMQQLLKFNICELETSYKLNRDVEDLDQRVKRHIPAHLAYACRFWGDHLSSLSKVDKDIISTVKSLLRSNFLFWLEILSLTERVGVAATQLSKIQDWLAFTVC
jgi:energy-coupling factor transporter ATP-binding protein EcfA2